MLRFRHFTGTGEALDAAINAWIGQESPDVRFMTQALGTDGALSVGFLYEEGFAAQERRMSADHGRGRGDTPPPSPREQHDVPIPAVPTPPGG